jgi:hypothetical protein
LGRSRTTSVEAAKGDLSIVVGFGIHAFIKYVCTGGQPHFGCARKMSPRDYHTESKFIN